jgi:hypothetical protein
VPLSVGEFVSLGKPGILSISTFLIVQESVFLRQFSRQKVETITLRLLLNAAADPRNDEILADCTPDRLREVQANTEREVSDAEE